jgi:hypothetical protein
MSSKKLWDSTSDLITLEIRKFHNAYMQTQHWSMEKAEEEQLKKLKLIAQKFHLNINSWEDFYKLPFMTKDDLPLDYVPTEENVIRVESSGSTGTPRAFYIPADHWKRKEAVFMRNWQWMEWNFQPVLRLGPAKPDPAFIMFDYCRNTKVLDRKIITDAHAKWVLENKPFLIHGRGGGVMETCMRVVKENSEGLRNTRIFWCGEDSTLGKKQLEPYIHSFYEGYGLAELAPTAGSCRYGNMHINMDCGIVEVVNGDIYVTDIDNTVEPIIRYKTGDEGKLRESDCPCGNRWPVLYDVKGRRTDYYFGPEVKKPIHWWVVGPLSHPPYCEFISAWKAEIYPKKGLFILYVVAREGKTLEVLEKYCVWVREQTGLECVIEQRDSAFKWKRDLVRVYV